MLQTILDQLEKIFKFLQFAWLWVFDRLIIYPLLAYIAPRIGMQFLNLGYWPTNYFEPSDVDDVNAHLDRKMVNFVHQNRDFDTNGTDSTIAHIYLYEKTLSMHHSYPNLKDLDILEVSCGQGNGLRWIAKKHNGIRNLVGVDKVVLFDNKNFSKGDAHKLPFDSASFDIILNVESSHLYVECSEFFRECFRVLRPGGHLCWTDIRYPDQIHQVQREAHHAGLRLDTWNDITANVLAGIEHTSRNYDQILRQSPVVIRMFASSLRSTYCAPGTSTYQRLVRRQRVYIAAMWTKPVENVVEEIDEE